MVAYNFKKEFTELVRTGKKAQTLRLPRKGRSRHARPGDALQLYTGMRTKNCVLLGRSVCTRVVPLTLHRDSLRFGDYTWTLQDHGREMHGFAKKDGFHNWFDMAVWFEKEHGLPFEAVMISWQPLTEGGE